MNPIRKIFDNLDHHKVVEHIEAEVQFNIQYFILLFLSVIIGTLGLIINNNAIIIGAMLLSPLIWPILGISLATVRSTRYLLRKSFALLVVSMLFIIAVAFLISFVSPFKDVGTEILGRTTPTVFDLIIALAAGTAATLILTWPKFSDALAGVAIAASLLPPICVTGIGLAYHNHQITFGSFILFLTNLASIIFAGIIIFSLARFYKRDDNEYVKRLSIGLFVSLLVILVISVQLIFSLKQILYEDNVQSKVRMVMNQELQKISQDITIDGVRIDALSNSTIYIDSDIKAPSHVVITVGQKNEVIQELSTILDRKVNLIMHITQVVEAANITTEDIEKQNYHQQIENIITQHAQKISSLIDVQSVEAVIKLNGERSFVVDTVWQIPESLQITLSDKESLINDLRKKLDGNVDVRMSFIRYFTLNDSVIHDSVDIIEQTRSILTQRTQDFAQEAADTYGIPFDYVSVLFDEKLNKYKIKMGIRLVEGVDLPDQYLHDLQESLAVVFYPVRALDIEFNVIYYTIQH